MIQYDDEIEVKMVSAVGSLLGKMIMPRSMREGLVKVYMDSGTVRHTYMYIDGEEITDDINYNPLVNEKV